MSGRRLKNICVTLFIKENSWAPTQNFLDKCKYCCWGIEKCPKTKKVHVHIYAELKGTARIETVKNYLQDKTAHVESRKGTREEAINYVKKEDSRLDGTSFQEYGELSQLKRTCNKSSLEEAIELLKISDINTVAEAFPVIFVKNGRGLRDLKTELDLKCEKEKPEIDVIIIWGDAGTGKSLYAKQMTREFGMKAWELSPNSGTENSLWFDGYNGEDVLIINDFEGKMIKHRTFLDMCDFGVRQWQVKGQKGGVAGTWKKVIITSNYDPQTWYKTLWEKYSVLKDAFFRRVNKIYKVSGSCLEDAVWEIQKEEPPRIFIKDLKIQPRWKGEEPLRLKRAREEREAIEQEDINVLNGQEKELMEPLQDPFMEKQSMEAESWADPESEILSDVDWTRGPDGTWIDKKFLQSWMEKEKERLGHYPDVNMVWKNSSPKTQDIKKNESIEKIIDRLRPQMAEEKRAFMERRQAMLRAEAGKKIEDAPPIEQVLPSLLEKASESELERLILPSPIPEEEEEDEREDTEKTERRRWYIWKGKTFDMDLLEEWLDEQEMRLGNFSSPSIPWKRSPSIQPDGSPCIPWKKSPSFEGAEGEDTE